MEPCGCRVRDQRPPRRRRPWPRHRGGSVRRDDELHRLLVHRQCLHELITVGIDDRDRIILLVRDKETRAIPGDRDAVGARPIGTRARRVPGLAIEHRKPHATVVVDADATLALVVRLGDCGWCAMAPAPSRRPDGTRHHEQPDPHHPEKGRCACAQQQRPTSLAGVRGTGRRTVCHCIDLWKPRRMPSTRRNIRRILYNVKYWLISQNITSKLWKIPMHSYRLQVFTPVARYRSYSRAAREALHISQPAVSKHVQALEAELGVPLVQRVASGWT